MKKRTLFVAIALIAMVFAFVSCSDDAAANKVGSISIGGQQKAISTVVTYNSDVEEAIWFYKATKSDDGYTTGQTSDFVPVVENAEEGLNGKILNSDGFSYGLWKIELKGYASTDVENKAPKTSTNPRYTATLTNFLVEADLNYATVEIEMGEGAETTIEFGDIWFTPSGSNVTTSSVFTLTVTDNKGTITNIPTAGTIDATTKKVSFSGLSYELSENQVITGDHTMEFTLSQAMKASDNSTSDISISAALYTLNFTVQAGTNTKISGDMMKNDQTGDIQINEFQGVEATTLDQIIPVTKNSSQTNATVKTTTTITVGDLSVTYPKDAIINPDNSIVNLNTDDAKSDGKVGFTYVSSDAPANVTITTNQVSSKYDLTLSTTTTESNTVLLTVQKYIGTGLDIVGVYHGETELGKDSPKEGASEYYKYNSTTGVLTLYVLHASDFFVITNEQQTYVAEVVGGAKYLKVQDAIDAASAGDTVKLLTDVSLAEANSTEYGAIYIDKALTFDLDGKTITVTAAQNNTNQANAIVIMNSAATTSFDVTIKNGTITTTVGAGGIMARDYSDVTLSNLTVTEAGYNTENHQSSNYRYAAVTAGGDNSHAGKVTIESGTYKADYMAVHAKSGSTVVIKDGTFEVTTECTSNPLDNTKPVTLCSWYANVTVDGGTFKCVADANGYGASAFIYVCDGVVNTINDGTFTGKVFINDETSSATYSYINGGTYKGTIYDFCGKGGNINIKVSGGTFINDLNSPVSNITVKDGYVVMDNGNSTWTVVAEANAIAKITNNGTTRYYSSLMAAIDSVPDENTEAVTVDLLRDFEGGGLTGSSSNAEAAKNLVLNFNNHTYTVINNSVGSVGTTSQAMHWGSSGNIVMKDGKFTTAENVAGLYMAAQIYCTFNAEDMTLDFSNIPVSHYGTFTGEWVDWSGLECPIFNFNGCDGTLTNCTVTFNAAANYGISFAVSGKTVILNKTTINGSADANEAGQTLKVSSDSSITKGCVSYFTTGSNKVKFETTNDGTYTVYTSVADI